MRCPRFILIAIGAQLLAALAGADELDDFVVQQMQRRNIPGLSIAIVDGGKIVKAKGYGVVEAGTTAAVTPATLFMAGSISKPVTAAAALALVDRTKLALDEDVNARLTTWKVPDNEFTTKSGTLHALEQEGVVPDLMTIAKGLGGGYQPIGAVLASSNVVDPLRRGSGSGMFQHGHTYLGHPTAAAAALAVQRVIERDGLLRQVGERGAYLRRALVDRLGEHPHVGDIRGRGLFLGVELVNDRASRVPFDPELKLHAQVKAEAMAKGLLVYPMGGTIDGRRGDHVLIAPPFIASEGQLDEAVDKLAAALDVALRGATGARAA